MAGAQAIRRQPLQCNMVLWAHSPYTRIKHMKSTKKVTNGKDISMMTKRGKWLMNIGTWNVRGLNSKEPELVQEFKKNKLIFLDD